MKRIVAALSLCALPPILAMTPDEFAETTQRVVAGGGFSDYQPTLSFQREKSFEFFPAPWPI